MRAHVRGLLGTAAMAGAAAALAACGGPAADLFGVQRSGTIPGADLQLVPSGDGSVKCDGRRRDLPDPLLLKAEFIADGIAKFAAKGSRLPSGPNPIYTYVVETPSGTFSFSDDSPHLPGPMRKLAAWARSVETTVCRR
jgi:hypothetical protein